jgi:hypothetical protein
MSEPLFLCAAVALPMTAFRRWMASPASRDWPGEPSIASALARFLADACDMAAGNHLLCRYDKPRRELQLAAHFRDGSTAYARQTAQALAGLVGEAREQARAKSGASFCVVAALDEIAWNDAGEGEHAAAGFRPPPWFMAWMNALAALGPSLSQTQWIAADILTAVAQAQRVLNASAEHPAQIGWLHTDGEQVYARVMPFHFYRDDPQAPGGVRMDRSEGGLYVVDGANPHTIRQIGESFYIDGNALLHFHMSHPPQWLADGGGAAARVYRLVDHDPDALVVMGDCAWNEAFDDEQPPQSRFYVKRTEVDGASFERIGGTDRFRDSKRRYRMVARIGLSVDEAEPEPEPE